MPILFQISLPWQPGSDAAEFVWRHSIARSRKSPTRRTHLSDISHSHTSWVPISSQMSLLWQPVSVVVVFVWHYSIALPRKPRVGRKNLVAYTSRVIADFVSNFVSKTTGVGRSRICLASFNSLTSKTPVIREDPPDISYTSRVIADFVPNFVAIATGVGRSRICLASFNSPTPKTPCYTQRSPCYLLYKPSYSRFGPKFRCHGNGGWSH